MRLFGSIDSAVASARLWALMLRIRDPAKLYKFWGVRVMNQARANARAKGGRKLWKQIADAVVLRNVSQRGADILGVGLWGRIGIHKEKGGSIRVRKKNFLTIPIDRLAEGKTAEEFAADNHVRLFRPGGSNSKSRILAYNDNGVLHPVFALCRITRPQKQYRWYPPTQWVLQTGIEVTKKMLEKK